MNKRMHRRKNGWLMSMGLILALSAGVTNASIDVYEFDDPQKEAQFRTLATELRCPKCQNQNVNDSNAPLAKDIKDRVFRMVNDGKSNDEIVAFMVERYGEFVTYRPRMSLGVALLWGAPAVLGLGVLILVLVMRRKSAAERAMPVDEQRIQSLLNQYAKDDATVATRVSSGPGAASSTSFTDDSRR